MDASGPSSMPAWCVNPDGALDDEGSIVQAVELDLKDQVRPIDQRHGLARLEYLPILRFGGRCRTYAHAGCDRAR